MKAFAGDKTKTERRTAELTAGPFRASPELTAIRAGAHWELSIRPPNRPGKGGKSGKTAADCRELLIDRSMRGTYSIKSDWFG